MSVLTQPASRATLFPGLVALAVLTGYMIALLAVEKQPIIIAVLAAGIAAALAAGFLGWLTRVNRSFSEHEDALGGVAVFAALVLGVYFHGTISSSSSSSRCCSPPLRRSA
jgi:ABC-type Mn2+/Zn2+ transport system permease subunit